MFLLASYSVWTNRAIASRRITISHIRSQILHSTTAGKLVVTPNYPVTDRVNRKDGYSTTNYNGNGKQGGTLWTEDELIHNIPKQFEPLPPDGIKKEILSLVQVLLLTVNNNEFRATLGYMKPLKQYSNVIKYHHRLDSPKSNDTAIYYVGQYGSCIAALCKIDPGVTSRTGASFAPTLAFSCFQHLGAIISMGVACGVKGRTNMCDVLVSSKVTGYDKARVEEGGFTPCGETVEASSYLKQIFSQTKWPHDCKEICKRLSENGMSLPKVYCGTILSGPYLIDDIEFKNLILKSFSKEAIGIEMEGASLFLAIRETNIKSILVKAVCDFGDGNKDKTLQPTAAMLAANFVTHVLSDPQIPGVLSPSKRAQTTKERDEYLANKLKASYKQTRYMTNTKASLCEPHHFTQPTLLHYKKNPNATNYELLATKKVKGMLVNNDNRILHGFEETEMIRDMTLISSQLENLQNDQPRIALLEGAPGMGKTVLLKEMAYQWANDYLFAKSDLVLLLELRDQTVQNMTSLTDLLKLYMPTELHNEAEHHARYIHQSCGKHVTLLLDGYDELPESVKEESFISNIIKKKELPEAALVITSRPQASKKLRRNAIFYADILGFTEEDQNSLIDKTLEDSEKVKELIAYLDNNSMIRSLCYTPFNMSALLWLYDENRPLPNSFSDIYNYIICRTIHNYIDKRANNSDTDDFANLFQIPDPYQTKLKQLSYMCLQSLNKKQFVFTLDEIKNFCPDIESFLDCFGLLQATEHCTNMGNSTKTLNFFHSSIQEYLAAYHITTLPVNRKLQLLEQNFFSEMYSNTFAFYVGMTKGQREAFKQFLADGGKRGTIADKFLSNDRKCFRLFHCFSEASDMQACDYIIKSMCDQKMINLQKSDSDTTRLLPTDIHYFTFFLSKSLHMKWREINMCKCHIGDTGFRLLHSTLVSSSIEIDEIDLRYNSLTSQSSQQINEILTSCKTKILNVSGNMLENGLNLSNNSTLEELNLYLNKVSTTAAVGLISSLVKNENSRLKVLNLRYNSISDEAVSCISQLIQSNNSLEKLYLNGNNFSANGIETIYFSAVKHNVKLDDTLMTKAESFDPAPYFNYF